MKVHMVILAAGRSLRYGKRDKLEEQVGGRKLLPSLLFKMQKIKKEWMGYQILVCGEHTETGESCIRKVINKKPEKGISYSISLAIYALQSMTEFQKEDAICFCVADQPFLKKETIETMIEEYLKSGKGIGCLDFDGPKNPCVFRAEYFQELQSLSGDTGGKKVLKRHMDDVFCYPAGKEEVWDMDEERTVVIRGGGDLASGVACVLYRKGYRILMLETDRPACIRRQVSFCEALYQETCKVEGITGRKISSLDQARECWARNEIPVLVDPGCTCLSVIRPMVLVDAILAKRNLGTKRDMAPLTFGLGPGFTAGKDVDFVVETMRGKTLAEVYRTGKALENTGIPGVIAGYGKERVIHAPVSGKIMYYRQVGDLVKQGEIIAKIDDTEISAPINGFLRGAIHEDYPIKKGLKIMDIEPRTDNRERCFHISDKAEKLGQNIWKAIAEWEKRCCGNYR